MPHWASRIEGDDQAGDGQVDAEGLVVIQERTIERLAS